MSIEQEVVSFVANFISVDRDKIDLTTLINDELGVDGDDGSELLEAFSAEFGVDILGCEVVDVVGMSE